MDAQTENSQLVYFIRRGGSKVDVRERTSHHVDKITFKSGGRLRFPHLMVFFEMRVFVALAFLCLASAAHYSSSSSESDELEDRLPILQKQTFNIQSYRQQNIPLNAEQLSGSALRDYVSQRQNLWTVNMNSKFANYTKEQRRQMMGVLNVRNPIRARLNLATTRFIDAELPESFDARQQWGSECPSVLMVRDQSSCGSCWAFGAVEAMSDRVCIASKGKDQPVLSARDLLSCCKKCGFGCDGGEPYEAFSYWHTTGIVTGSNYSANAGCLPYPFPPCEHHSTKKHFQPCPKEIYHTPKCVKTCKDGYSRDYVSDKYYGQEPFAVDDNEDAIKKELYTNGPLEATLDVYEDFLSYGGGVYVHQGGQLDGGHAVKLVGWGVENKVPYWTLANSWNSDWGEDGFFRILRGANECGIESGIVGAIPDLKRSPQHYHHHHLRKTESYDIFY